MPASEMQLIDIVDKYAVQYVEADNELKKSKLLSDRDAALKAAHLPPVIAKDWVGKVEELKTDWRGRATVSVRISDRTVIKTLDITWSDSERDSSIPQSDPLYNIISNLKTGMNVRFTAQIFKMGAVFE